MSKRKGETKEHYQECAAYSTMKLREIVHAGDEIRLVDIRRSEYSQTRWVRLFTAPAAGQIFEITHYVAVLLGQYVEISGLKLAGYEYPLHIQATIEKAVELPAGSISIT